MSNIKTYPKKGGKTHASEKFQAPNVTWVLSIKLFALDKGII